MPIKQGVLKDCPKIKAGTLNNFALRVLDAGDYKAIDLLGHNISAGCILACCNGRYTECNIFKKWCKKNNFHIILIRNPETIKKDNSYIEGGC